MSFRADGSYNSANNPTVHNNYSVLDFGLYKAQVIEAVYADSNNNTTSADKGPQVLYKVRIIGGIRDGQVFRTL